MFYTKGLKSFILMFGGMVAGSTAQVFCPHQHNQIEILEWMHAELYKAQQAYSKAQVDLQTVGTQLQITKNNIVREVLLRQQADLKLKVTCLKVEIQRLQEEIARKEHKAQRWLPLATIPPHRLPPLVNPPQLPSFAMSDSCVPPFCIQPEHLPIPDQLAQRKVELQRSLLEAQESLAQVSRIEQTSPKLHRRQEAGKLRERFEKTVTALQQELAILQEHKHTSKPHRHRRVVPKPEPELMECPVCLDLKTAPEMVTLPRCRHQFCKNCIDGWVDTRRHAHKKPRCPLCRRKFETRSRH